MRRLEVKGLPRCRYCHGILWSPIHPNIDGKWLVLYCNCTDGRFYEYSLKFLLNKGWWPVPQAGYKVKDMFCPNPDCNAARVVETPGTTIVECSECGAKYHITPSGLVRVL